MVLLIESLQAFNLACRREGSLVFNNVSFSMQAGSAMLIRGPNGSGKTSLLRIIGGLGSSISGGFMINGQPVPAGRHSDFMSGRVHYMAAREDGLEPILTVKENLDYWMSLYRGSALQMNTAIDRLDVRHLLNRPVNTLSSGQRRIISMARIMSAYCQVWLLDEPTNTLDRRMVAVVEDCVRKHRATGGIVFVVSHADIALEDAVSLELR